MQLHDITTYIGIALLMVSFSEPSWAQTRVEGGGSAQGTTDDSGEFWFTDVRPGTNDTQNPGITRGLNPQPEPPTNEIMIQNPGITRGLNPQPEPPTNEIMIQNPGITRGLNPQPEPPTNDIIISAERRAAFSALNGYNRARTAMTEYMLAKIQERNTPDADALPNEVAGPWNALASEAVRQGYQDEIDILAWSLIEDAMQAGDDETRVHARQLHLDSTSSIAARSRESAQRRERGTAIAIGRYTYEPIRIPPEPNQNVVGNDAQLANVDLQTALQRQQQTLQTMSNVSKMLHDTAMAVIRKIGG